MLRFSYWVVAVGHHNLGNAARDLGRRDQVADQTEVICSKKKGKKAPAKKAAAKKAPAKKAPAKKAEAEAEAKPAEAAPAAETKPADEAKPAAAAPELKAGEGTPAEGYTFLRSVQYNNGEPFSVVNLHLAKHIFDKDRKRFTHSAALPQILEMPDVTISQAPQTFTIGVADPETANLLEIGLGEPTADSRLILIDDNGVAIYVASIHYHKDCFALRVELLDHSKRRQRTAK